MWVENTVGKGEIARQEQFLLFPQCFHKACFPGASKGVIVWEWVKSLIQVGLRSKLHGLKYLSLSYILAAKVPVTAVLEFLLPGYQIFYTAFNSISVISWPN